MSLVAKKKDIATEQTAAGTPSLKEIASTYVFTEFEINVLRELAKEVEEIANRSIEQEKVKLWTAHNDLKNVRPMIFADPENGWNEIVRAEKLKCTEPLARVWEMVLRKQIFWAKEMKDDKVIELYFDVPYSYTDTGWGFELKKQSVSNGGSYKVVQAIVDYEEDFEKIHYPELIIDYEESDRALELAHEIFDDILKVRRKTFWWWTLGMTWDYINLRGLEDFMVDTLIEPEWVKKTLNMFSNGILKRLDFLEEKGLLGTNTEGSYVGSGGFGWTNQLPKYNENAKVKTMDMWGFCDSQETVGINPDAFGELILPYQIPILERFGLNCYGCCEPLDPRWKYIKQIPRLRRVSCSPWSNKAKMAEYCKNNYIMSTKPIPTPLASKNMDEIEVRREVRQILKDTKGCVVELLMKDNHTLGNNPKNITRWVEIAREEIENM